MSINKKSGFTFIEILISVFILSMIMLGFAGFTSNFFNVSATHSSQIKAVTQARFSTERIITQINKAAYIYPSGVNIAIGGTTINTSTSVAMLIPQDNGTYNFVAYYLVKNAQGLSDLYEFFSGTTSTWTQNTCPATTLLSFTGSSSLLANNLNPNKTTLTYILNYKNSVTDTILKGSISNVSVTAKDAIIKGIDWQLYQNNTTQIQTITIKGIAINVPRFVV